MILGFVLLRQGWTTLGVTELLAGLCHEVERKRAS